MSKLKTLKDIQKDCEWKLDTYNALRDEAIKWIKELSEPSHEFVKNNGLKIDEINYGNYWELKKIKQWIKIFFNITEEDLK